MILKKFYSNILQISTLQIFYSERMYSWSFQSKMDTGTVKSGTFLFSLLFSAYNNVQAMVLYFLWNAMEIFVERKVW